MSLEGLSRFKHDLDLHNGFTPYINEVRIHIDNKDPEFYISIPESDIVNIVDNRPLSIIIRYDNSDIVFGLFNAEELSDGQELTYCMFIPNGSDNGSVLLTMVFSHNTDSYSYRVDSDIQFLSGGGGGGDIDYADNSDIDDMFIKYFTYSLNNCYCSNEISSITEDSSYYAVITPYDNCSIDWITVMMSGIDITSDVVSGNEINIPNVAGNVEISASASGESSTYNIYFENVSKGVTIDDDSSTIGQGAEYTNEITVDQEYIDQGYHFTDVHISMGGNSYDGLLSFYDGDTRCVLSGLYAADDITWTQISIGTKK